MNTWTTCDRCQREIAEYQMYGMYGPEYLGEQCADQALQNEGADLTSIGGAA